MTLRIPALVLTMLLVGSPSSAGQLDYVTVGCRGLLEKDKAGHLLAWLHGASITPSDARIPLDDIERQATALAAFCSAHRGAALHTALEELFNVK